MDHVLDPGVVGVACRWDAVLPPLVLAEAFTTPIAHVERWIGQNEVGSEVWMEVLVEGIGCLGAEVGLYAANGEIHLRQPPRRRVGLLPVDGDVPETPPVLADELVT